MIKLWLRKANWEDLDLLYQWANEPAVRRNAFHTEQIPYEDHVKWYHTMMTNPTTYQYLLCVENIPVGQIRLNVEDSEALISYSVAADQRGKGYGIVLLRLVQSQIQVDKISSVTKLKGLVKYGNTASMRAFEHCGYSRTEQPEYIQYTKQCTCDPFTACEDNL